MDVNYQPLTPLSFLDRNARIFPDRLAVVDGEMRLTYREFHARASALAAGLDELGVRAGDRVAFLALNGEPLLTAHFGVPMSGAVLVAINARLAPDEILHILKHAGVCAFFVDPALFPHPDRLKSECPDLRAVINLEESYDEFLKPGTGRLPGQNTIDEKGLIALNYTSGTTGDPKGVMYTHRGAYLNALGTVAEIGLTNATRYLWTLPMFHCNGWCYTWSVTAAGGVHVCIRKPVPGYVFRLVEAEAITHLCAAPTVLIDLAEYAAVRQLKLQTPLTIMTGGAPPAPQVIRNIETIGARVIHLYGLTETYGPSALCQWLPEWDGLSFQEQAAMKARQGVGDLMVEQRVVRADMSDVEPNGEEVGEVVIRGNAVMKGYYRDEEATRQAFRGGWFHTADLAVVHPNRYIEIRDRAKDIIITGGENVSTLEVERVIYTHPAVLEVAVVATPHERWGEVPHAFVVTRPGPSLTAEELYEYCRARLAAFKCPKRVDFVTELPKTSTGKIQKYVLRRRDRSE
jgi:fatty-acyl-CoA synthase